MATDMKEHIVSAAEELLVANGTKKITVKDIVEKCHITRQTFYYHFDDIPALIRWALDRETTRLLEDLDGSCGVRENLINWFRITSSSVSYMMKSMEKNYGEDWEKLITSQLCKLIAKIIEKENLYPDATKSELDIIIRYHSYAAYGFIKNRSEEDSANAEQTVEEMYFLLTGKKF